MQVVNISSLLIICIDLRKINGRIFSQKDSKGNLVQHLLLIDVPYFLSLSPDLFLPFSLQILTIMLTCPGVLCSAHGKGNKEYDSLVAICI